MNDPLATTATSLTYNSRNSSCTQLVNGPYSSSLEDASPNSQLLVNTREIITVVW